MALGTRVRPALHCHTRTTPASNHLTPAATAARPKDPADDRDAMPGTQPCPQQTATPPHTRQTTNTPPTANTGGFRLKRLSVQDARRLESVDALTRLPALEELSISSARKLRDYTPVGSLRGLKKLWLPGCTHLERLDFITGLRSLRVLGITDCGQIETARPLAALTGLRELYAYGSTWFTDTDVSAIAGLALTRLAIANRREYRPRLASIGG